MILRFFKLLLFCVAFYGAKQFCQQATDGFTILQLAAPLPELSVSSGVPRDVFDQPFHYLGRGGQAFVFASQDGHYVIKFFIHQRKIVKRERDFTSYRIAGADLKEESGLACVHLNRTVDLKKQLTIVDKLGIAHSIDLDNKAFVLQKKADLFYPYLEQLLKTGQREKVQEAIASLVALIGARCEKGVYDEDAKLHRNFGFLENRAIFIDVGRFRKDTVDKKREAAKILQPLQVWLEGRDPALTKYVQEKIDEV